MDGGIAVSGPYERGYFCSIYFSDPAGQILEIDARDGLPDDAVGIG